ncbi:MAG: hypothetical protein WC562_00035 [Dehalococcoidia bacterium]
MAIHNTFECSSCGYTVRTSGPWEFYRDESGQRQPYGHPRAGPMMTRKSIMKIRDKTRRREMLTQFESWLKRQPSSTVNGFSENLYCRQCDEVRYAVIYEFEHPGDVDIAWNELADYRWRRAIRNWFRAKPNGLRNICRWVRAMPGPQDSIAARKWDGRRLDPICPTCGTALIKTLHELPCPRCKEGVFQRTHCGDS